jgi:hypothetical protein
VRRQWTCRTPIGFNSLRPVAGRINAPVRVAGTIAAITPIPASPTAAATPTASVTPEVAAASGDAGPANVHMGPTNVHMAPANVHMGPASGEVTAAEVASTKVASTKVTAASVSAASVSASTTSKGRCRDCSTTQKDSGDGYEQYFSHHQDLHHSVSSTKLCRRIFSPVDAIFRTMRVDDRLRPLQ